MPRKPTPSHDAGDPHHATLDAEVRMALFYGPEAYLQQAGRKALLGALRDRFGEIETVRFDGNSASMSEVLDECRSFGLMTVHKMVLIEEAVNWLRDDDEQVPGGRGNDGDDDLEDDGDAIEVGVDHTGPVDAGPSPPPDDDHGLALFGREPAKALTQNGRGKSPPPPPRVERRALTKRMMLERYAESPSQNTTLVVCASSLGTMKWPQKLFAEAGVAVRCDQAGPEDATEIAVRRMRELHGRELRPEVARTLVDRLGTNLGRLVHEVDKLALAVDPGREIALNDVTTMVGLTREQQNWEIKKALLAGDPERAIGLMHELMTVSRVPMQLIRWNFLDLAKALYALAESEAGRGSPVSPRDLRLWGEEDRRARAIARGASLARLRALLEAAVDADHRAKTGQGNEIRALELLAIEFASLAR